jgi:argininosuccinate lyase
MTLWNGRFDDQPDSQMWALNASLSFDQRMALQDVRGSLAWAEALESAGILSRDERTEICDGLQQIEVEFRSQSFGFVPQDEDIHTAVERRLGELIGPTAGKLHTGRSRNDQVATDFRLWMLDHLPALESALSGLQAQLVNRAESDMGTLIPGYTHLQRAQPLLLSHWWLSHFWPLHRDQERLADLKPRLASLPLGAGALAGTPFDIDRSALADVLGFAAAAPNSIDAVSDRDFAVEFLFSAALIGVHLSKLAEQIIIFTSAEFGFFELSDAYSTGSSLMPQKKNPDPFELARGKSGTLLGKLIGLLTTLKGLPSTYDKDLQEDKVPVFQAYDTLMALLPVMAGALATLKIYPERMQAAIDPSMMTTDLADYLVERSIPFREAHALTGQAVRLALKKGNSLKELTLAEYQEIHPIFDQDVYGVFDAQKCVSRRTSLGGTAPEAVKIQIELAKDFLQTNPNTHVMG